MPRLSLLLPLALLSSVARAANPREDFKAAVAAVQKAPADAALREKAITLAKKLKPSPAIPEGARKAMVKGTVFQKEAKDDAAYAKAEDAFRDATTLAPWWADAYYNLSLVQELRKDYPGAAASLKLFLAAAPPSEARDGQDRLYGIEARSELAAAEKSKAAELAAAERAKPDWSGRWGDDHSNHFEFTPREGGETSVRIFIWNGESFSGHARIDGRSIKGTWDRTVTSGGTMCPTEYSGTLSEDSQRLEWKRKSFCGGAPMEFELTLTREKS
jgi:tetratricopeptide (TPR) repeat protein